MERDSRYINAPVWPWSVAGWSLAAMFILFFVAAWSPFVGVAMLTAGMVALALVSFAAMLGFVKLCDRV
jgi:hypothetical protein